MFRQIIKKKAICKPDFGGKAYGLSLLYKNSYPIPKTLAVQATDNLDDIDSLDFRENLLKK